jgi:gliding motility-associated protein GldM
MSIPKEPRQIMINLMYLVLTALLALNVSNEILNAFKTLSSSIDRSNRSIEQKTAEVYAMIKENEEAPGQREKVRPFREKADEVVKRSDEMVAKLNNWKRRIVVEAGGYSEHDSTVPDKMDNIDATTLLLVEKHGADSLKNEMLALRQFMLEQVKPSDSGAMSRTMPLNITPAVKNDHNPKADWGIENFEHMPAIAALALFAKFQNDVRASQSLIINRLFEEAHLKDIKFDTIGAVAVPNQSYALEGDKIEASIMLAAFNKAQKPEVKGLSGGGSTKPAVNGIIPWETIAHGTGLQTVKGKIELQTESGPISRDWKFEYMVGTTGASMQLDKMNVFYIGVDNPVTVAAAGYSVEDVSLDIPGATIRDSAIKGHYIIRVEKLGTVNVAIMAKTKEGPVKKVGGMPVRVKRIPDPVAKVGGVIGGVMPASSFRLQIAPAATLESFDFDAKFKIISFSFSMLPKGRDYIGPYTAENRTVGTRFNANPIIAKTMEMARPGDKVFIESIKAVGPDGKVRELNPIILSLN